MCAGKKTDRRSEENVSAVEEFFRRDPATLPVYRELEMRLRNLYPACRFRVGSSQISVGEDHTFCAFWLPVFPVKGRPEHYLVLTIFLNHGLDSDRPAEQTQVRPGRFSHHLLIESSADWDRQVENWVEEARIQAMSN